jgi:hypothetical protein
MEGCANPGRRPWAWLGIIVQVLAFGFVIAVTGCSDSDNGPCCPDCDGPDGTTIYFTSFESPSDTLAWSTYGTVMLTDDAPPGGGSGSLLITGGCDGGFARLRLGPLTTGSSFTIRFWAKKIGPSAPQAVLTIAEKPYDEMIGVSVTTSEWSSYAPDDQLFCPRGKSLLIEFHAGGFAGGTLLTDLLEVVRLGE